MASVSFLQVNKVYTGSTHAVRDLSIEIKNGELLVLVGPSGCGKSTILRMLAGLEEVSSGEIRINGKRVNHLAPQQRNIAMVFQNYALYPHMSVRNNMLFPLKMMRLVKEEQQRRIRQTAELLGLKQLLDRRPKSLSGGQRQRVAMARALVRNPAVLLLDEPLSNLDAGLRLQIREEIGALQHQTGRTTLYVTHDQVEAMTLGHRVAVLKDGILQQVAPPQILYEQPANIFVAGFLGSPGMNIFPTMLRKQKTGIITLDIGRYRLPVPQHILDQVEPIENLLHSPLSAGLRPEAFSCGDTLPTANQIIVTVTGIETLGHEKIISVVLSDASLPEADFRPSVKRVASTIAAGTVTSDQSHGPAMTLRLPARFNVQVGARLKTKMDTAHLHLFDAKGNALNNPAK
jgi:multiple sugar transport system ATP-binding protein